MSRHPRHRCPVLPVPPVTALSDLPLLCTTADAARLLRCTPEQISRRACAGELSGVKDGKQWLFRREELFAYLNQLFQKAGAHV